MLGRPHIPRLRPPIQSRPYTPDKPLSSFTVSAPARGCIYYGVNAGLLDDTTFNIGPNTYTVQSAFVYAGGSRDGDLQFTLDDNLSDAEHDALRLHVCDTPYDFSAAGSPGSFITWADDLDWSHPVVTRTLYLSLPANNAPTAADNTVTTGVGTAYTFKADDFGFADADAIDVLASVKIVTLPAAGTLALDGTAVMQNDVVAWDDIEDDKLTFMPVAGAGGTGYATFTFKVNDGTVDSAIAYTMTIDVTACAAPDLAGRDRIWTGTVTVGAVIDPSFNIATSHGYDTLSQLGAVGALDETTFNIGRNAYTVREAVVFATGTLNAGDLRLFLSSKLTEAETDALRLHVCDTPYDFSDAVGEPQSGARTHRNRPREAHPAHRRRRGRGAHREAGSARSSVRKSIRPPGAVLPRHEGENFPECGPRAGWARHSDCERRGESTYRFQ